MAGGYRNQVRRRELLGVRVETVRRWERDGKARTSRTTGGQREVPAEGRSPGSSPNDARPTDGPGPHEPAQCLPGVIAQGHEGPEVSRDPSRCPSRSRTARRLPDSPPEAADELGLEAGMEAVATVKATSVMVEGLVMLAVRRAAVLVAVAAVSGWLFRSSSTSTCVPRRPRRPSRCSRPPLSRRRSRRSVRASTPRVRT